MPTKFIAIGDVHTEYDLLWAALKAASCIDAQGLPTAPVRQGMYQVVLIGDLVHPKNIGEYTRLLGGESFDINNPEHLYRSAREQMRQLDRIMRYQQAAPHAVHILLGNHDDNILNHRVTLGTKSGLVHLEFDGKRNGLNVPLNLRSWMMGFMRELRVGAVQFAHVGPMPGMVYYDDLFYADQTHKRWWQDTPEYVQMAGLTYGVYGHTQMTGGIHLDAARFAMIDALSYREYLELLLEPSASDPVLSVKAVPF